MKKIHKPELFKNKTPIEFNPEPGLVVKVWRPGELFWTIIQEVKGPEIMASVDNDLIDDHGYNYGDLISFKKDDVWDVSGKVKYNSFSSSRIK